MTDAAALVFTDGELHTLGEPNETHTALAVRDGEIVRVGNDYDIEFLIGPETTRVDLDGRVVLPGFVDAHTHLTNTGRSLVHADLSTADTASEAVDLLAERAAETSEDEGSDRAAYVLGFGYDESSWPSGEYLTAADLDPVGGDRPVVAFREDMHVASVDSVTLERHRNEMPDDDVQTTDDASGGEPTGVVVEEAVDPLYEAVEPDRAGTRELIEAAQTAATRRGVTGIHDMVRRSYAPEVYRTLDAAGELDLRVRLNYWTDHLDALIETGARTNHGSEMVQTGAIKTYTDGSFGGRTAKLSEPYADGDGTGQWVVDPEELREYVARADDHGFQFTAHAIGDEAIRAVVDAYEECPDPETARHRIEHVELADDDLLDRIADAGIVASMQPNFLKWAGEDGLYDARLGDRRGETNRLAAHHDRDTHLAFGSDCMPLDPLVGVHHAVNAPEPAQRLGVTDALRAYTSGAAYAGFDEDRLGTVEPGKRADLTVLDASPWEQPDAIREISVAATVVDGRIVYRRFKPSASGLDPEAVHEDL